MKSKSLVLVHPPQPALLEGFSAGLVALANWVAAANPDVDVEVQDLGLAAPDTVDQVVSACTARVIGPPFVGITTTTSTYQSALRVARAFKRYRRDCIVILGGPHASPEAEVILRNRPEVDLVIVGEGERALSDLLREPDRLEAVPNLAYRQGAHIRRNPPAAFLRTPELDGLDPAFGSFGIHSAPGKFGHVTYVSARGCPLKCSFCAVSNEAIRQKSVEAIIRDLRHLVIDLGFRDVAIEDNFFAHSPARTLELCNAIAALRTTVSFRWDCQTRVESMRREDVRNALEEAGCEAVYLGVESLSTRTLEYLGKAANPDFYLKSLNEEVVPALLRSRIDCYINLQFGVRGERLADWQETYRNLRELGTMAARHGRVITVFPQLAVVYPGTRHYDQALREGRYAAGVEIFERFTEWEAGQEPVLFWLGDHFAHGTGGIPDGILDPERLRSHPAGFAIDVAAVDRVSRQLEMVKALPGIKVFDYTPFLAKRATVSERAARRRLRKRA